jgi:hypothetical protein
MAAELRRKPGVAEDRRRWSFAEGGAARRPREHRQPRAAVASGPAGGGCGGGAASHGGASLLPLRWAVVLLPLQP